MAVVHDSAANEAKRTMMGRYSDHAITREYYSRTYPRGFLYIYDTLLRKCLRANTPYKLEFAAEVLELMLQRQRKELDLLPDWPYFNKFLRRMNKSRVPPKPENARPSRLWQESQSTSGENCSSALPPSTTD